MLSIVKADEDGVVVLDTTDDVPVLEIACAHCTFQLSMVACTPVTYASDVTGMADAIANQHRTAAHPELVR